MRTAEQKRLRCVQAVWALLFFNVLSFTVQPIVFPIPHVLGEVLTQGALVVAFGLALAVNPKVKIRPSLFLGLYSGLAAMTLMMSVRFVSLGTVYRSFRLIGFLAVLWLLTPWWGRRDLLLLRTQIRFLVAVLISVFLGLLLSPSKAYILNAGARRLAGAIWPMPSTQVGHYVAELSGLALLLWACGIWARRRALLVAVPSVAALLLTHTRTALLAMIVALVVAGLSLLTGSRRVRRAFAVTLILGVTVALPLSPVLSSWLVRGETPTEVSDLSGRTEVWPQVLSEPRPETNKIFGTGMTNGSVVGAPDAAYDGLPIDSGWVSTYQNQGLIGMVLEGLMFLVLLVAALIRPRGPTRAIALFLIVYSLIASFTETGMGDASTYLVDLALAASLLVLPLPGRPPKPVAPGGPAASRWLWNAKRSAGASLAVRYVDLTRRQSIDRSEPNSVWPREITALAGESRPIAAPTRVEKSRLAALWGVVIQTARRLGWGVADQAVSSVTNFAVSIYIARTLGVVQYGAFALAFVTYSFMLNASRGLATDPLLVRFSGSDVPTWRRAVADCTGTAAAVGLATGACTVAAAALLGGSTRLAFLALGLTLPGLLLQDSWRFCFFAHGRGGRAFLNDAVWALVMAPGLVLLRLTGNKNVFWFVFVWGAAASAGAVVGPLQAHVLPRISRARQWVHTHRDLGPRYLAEGTANTLSLQVRTYALGLILGLAAVGYVQAASTLMGPFMVIFFGMGLVILPEAVRVLTRAPHRLMLFCATVSGGLALVGLAWGVVLLVVLPRGVGYLVLGHLWRPTYPLLLPLTFSVIGGCIMAGAGTGLHALGASKRSLRAMAISSAIMVLLGTLGAVVGGALGTVQGLAIAGGAGAVLFWCELRAGVKDYGNAVADPPAPHSDTAIIPDMGFAGATSPLAAVGAAGSDDPDAQPDG